MLYHATYTSPAGPTTTREPWTSPFSEGDESLMGTGLQVAPSFVDFEKKISEPFVFVNFVYVTYRLPFSESAAIHSLSKIVLFVDDVTSTGVLQVGVLPENVSFATAMPF